MAFSYGTPSVLSAKIVLEDKQNDELRMELKLDATTMNSAAIEQLVDDVDRISRLSVRRVMTETLAPNGSYVQNTDGVTNQPLQLVFQNVMGYQASFPFPHADNSCFVDTSGTGANSKVLLPLADLDAAASGTAPELLGNFIHHILDGDIVWTIRGLPPTEFIRGYRDN